MADYYALIARAVARLPQNTDKSRRALYNHARDALVTQLRGRSVSDLKHESDDLEEAIRKVEMEVNDKLHTTPSILTERPGSALVSRITPYGRRPAMPIAIGLLATVLVIAIGIFVIAPTNTAVSPPAKPLPPPQPGQAESLCPAPKTSGAGIGASGLKVVYGHLAKLASFGPPIRFDDLSMKVELGDVNYGAAVSGSYTIPFTGNVGSLKIDGKSMGLKSGKLNTGCIDVEEIGPVLVLFGNSLTSESATIVVTPGQFDRLK